MSTSGSAKSSRGRIGVIISVVVILVIIIAGFVASVPVSTVVGLAVPRTYIASSTSQYQTSTVSQMPISEQTTTNQAIFNIGTTLLAHGSYDYSTASLPASADVQVSWTTDNNVNVFVFSSSEYSAYTGSGTTSPNIASKTSTGSGTLSFIVSAADTYYLVLSNTNNGFFGIGAKNDTVSSSGSASYNVQTTVYVAQTNTYIATTTLYTTITTTSTSTTTSSCSIPFWEWIAGTKC